jgi:pimeloyl-ACP methyl ester carboxylesterase
MTTLLTLAAALLAAVTALVLFSWYTTRRIETALPARGRMVEVPGATLHVREQGNGPALLMIHGLAGQMAHYTYGIVDRLAADYRVVTVDRPGSGHSTRHPGTTADLSSQAAAMAALIDKLDLGRPLVVGHSLGGAVALALALEHPERTCGLALIAPATHMPDSVPPAFKGLTIGSKLARTIVAWTLAVPAAIRGSRAVLAQVFGPEPVPRDFATRGGGLLGLRPSTFLSASSDLQALPLHLPNLEQSYARLRLPVSVLYGRDDGILDWRANGQGLVDKVPGARLQLVDGGHMLPVTQPARCADFIREAAVVANATAKLKAG